MHACMHACMHARSLGKKQITISTYDCEMCFDSLWQEDIINDLFEAGITDDKLSLMYKINEINKLVVKTHDGLSQRKTVENI